MKKIISLILAVILIATTVISVSAANYGDINGDGKVTALDTVFLGRYLAKWSSYKNISEENAYIDIAIWVPRWRYAKIFGHREWRKIWQKKRSFRLKGQNSGTGIPQKPLAV